MTRREFITRADTIYIKIHLTNWHCRGELIESSSWSNWEDFQKSTRSDLTNHQRSKRTTSDSRRSSHDMMSYWRPCPLGVGLLPWRCSSVKIWRYWSSTTFSEYLRFTLASSSSEKLMSFDANHHDRLIELQRYLLTYARNCFEEYVPPISEQNCRVSGTSDDRTGVDNTFNTYAQVVQTSRK